MLPTGFLALPADGDATYGKLTHKLRLLALRRLLLLGPADVEPPVRRALAGLQSLLQLAARGDGGPAVVGAVGQVDVLAPLLAVESGLLPAVAAVPALVPTLLVALARRTRKGALRESLVWDVPFVRLVDAERGVVLAFEPPARGAAFDPTGVEVRTYAGAPVDALAGEGLRLPPIVGPIRLGLCDTNPLAMVEDHPDKAGNAVDLGGRDPAAWCAALRDALDLVAVALPSLAREIEGSLQRLVPVGYEPERHLSASYREAPGLAYLTLHPSLLTLAEAIVHETQHGKLNTLRWLDPVLDNGESTWTASPVRPDLRPLMGVLMAVHAFVPVAALHHRLYELGHPLAQGPTFERRRAEVARGNAHGLAALRELGRPTALGERTIAALEALHAATGGPTAAHADGASLDALG
jgi:HEXXH motif-containing protein